MFHVVSDEHGCSMLLLATLGACRAWGICSYHPPCLQSCRGMRFDLPLRLPVRRATMTYVQRWQSVHNIYCDVYRRHRRHRCLEPFQISFDPWRNGEGKRLQDVYRRHRQAWYIESPPNISEKWRSGVQQHHQRSLTCIAAADKNTDSLAYSVQNQLRESARCEKHMWVLKP